MRKILFFLFSIFLMKASAQQADTVFLKKLIESHPDLFDAVLKDPEHKQVQLIYTQIDYDKHNAPKFTNYSYRLDPIL
ncbi:hypothetical protein [Olivibacter domesticus]|uniref:Uncharacterized protein n=1 Tax=Olivibacter domesticus TaxID=407022 RepID=A0A1H7HYR4_OLID1|nr:hypothetical protein [Olivibacter domesticus]SEK55308.1 hypothetical protein SAMN05661044_00527 [Olivibacter domesticus]